MNARTITTAVELDALPFPNAVTFPGHGDWHKRRDGWWLCDDGDVLTSGALALVANGELTVTGDPSAPSEATAAVVTPPVMRIEGTWLVEVVDEHTCGAGPGSGTGMHEPGCGLVPVLDLATLPGWDEHLTAAPSATRDEVARALEGEFGCFLARDPHRPDAFWGGAADALLARFTITPKEDR